MGMKYLILALILSFINCNAENISQNEIRLLYQKAATDEKSCLKLISLLEAYDEQNNVLCAGYKASAIIINAKYNLIPYTKFSLFSTGKKMLEKSIQADIQNIELRYLRFTIQTKIPKFLNYSDSIEKDKTYLLKSVTTLKDNMLKQLIISFLLQSNSLTNAEKLSLKS